MNIKHYAFAGMALLAAIILSSCGNSGYKKTKTGMTYNIISEGKGDSLKQGEYIKINFKLTLGDSVIQDTWQHMPAYGPVDTSIKDQHFFTDILPLMKVGDSAVFIRSVDTLIKMGQMQPNPKYPAGTTMKGYLKIIGKFKDQQEVQADYKKEEEKEIARGSAQMEKYLKDKNITGTKTPSGAYIVITKPGTGPMADTGRFVSILYHGTTKEGLVFDSNTDTAHGKQNQPFEFVLGRDPVIKGWVEGLKYFNAGSKGKIFVPAMLAYGPEYKSQEIKPFTDLIFDIELLSVKDAPPPAPAAPQGMPMPPGQ